MTVYLAVDKKTKHGVVATTLGRIAKHIEWYSKVTGIADNPIDAWKYAVNNWSLFQSTMTGGRLDYIELSDDTLIDLALCSVGVIRDL